MYGGSKPAACSIHGYRSCGFENYYKNLEHFTIITVMLDEIYERIQTFEQYVRTCEHV